MDIDQIILNRIDEVILNSKASQDKAELHFVYEQVSQIAPKVIVEVGSWHGDLLQTLNDLFHPKLLIGIENDASVFLEDNKKFLWINKDSNDPGTVETLKGLLLNRPIDYLFIDGGHKYEEVKKDFALYAPLVRDGGIVGFHDVALEGLNADGHSWWDIGLQVKKFWDEQCLLYPHKEFRGSTLATGTGLLYL